MTRAASDTITNAEKIGNGVPIIRGKRITVQTIYEFVTAGESVEEILNE